MQTNISTSDNSPVAESDLQTKAIDVGRDFNGDLAAAIASVAEPAIEPVVEPELGVEAESATPPTSATPPEPATIDVEQDFDGDLAAAIAAAKDGDVVVLGAKVYQTPGITIDKDITIAGAIPDSTNLESAEPIEGKPGSIIDGGGTSGAILNLTTGATGATIQEVEITNGNNGIIVNDANDVTLQNLEIHNIGITEPVRDGVNNIGINLDNADGFELLDSNFYNIGRKGVGISNTNGGIVDGLTLEDINIDAEHAQSFDAAGIKLFNTNDITVSNNNLTDINAFNIWNDLTNSTTMDGNVITNVGVDFLAPEFNQYVTVSGIYNEKSYESVVTNNDVTAVDDFLAFDATEFTTETMVLGENTFSSVELNSTDYWHNESMEKQVAITEDPGEAGFDLFEEDFYEDAIIG